MVSANTLEAVIIVDVGVLVAALAASCEVAAYIVARLALGVVSFVLPDSDVDAKMAVVVVAV